MGSLQIPESFNMRELELDVSLQTCIDGSSYDFTGRKTFNTSFYRNNIGFGITNIEIEINTSLQPIIDITFKDLYGNTLFGTQRTSNDSIDTSVLFNWPPPKFIFSFKGYLGRKVTWLLNLKTTNVNYVSSDGSYEIKCSFVPNQWGFLADIPVLYLLACKKLRYEAYGNNATKPGSGVPPCAFTTDSIFSYTRIGKRVETKTTEETKDFDLLTQQLAAIKYGLAGAVFTTKTIKLNEPINGIINNIPIQGFTNVMVSDGGEKTLTDKAKDKSVNMLNTFLQLNLKKAADGNPEDANYNSVDSIALSAINDKGELIAPTKPEELTQRKNNIFSIIDKNLSLIDDEIKRRIYNSTKTQISKLTIGEVFRQIARDSGFILGSILQAGFAGYNDPNYKSIRDTGINDGKMGLVGKCFPLFITSEGEEIPAMKPLDPAMVKGTVPDINCGVQEHEMKFVEDFISAIGEGIAENLISDDIAGSSEDKVKKRINNLEALQPNPYKPYYSNIVENILIRSGIIAYITRGSDPNNPGGFPTDVSLKNPDSPKSIITLANSDMENLTKDIIGQLSFEDKAGIKRFCTFFDRLISDDGDKIMKSDGVGVFVDGEADIGEYFLNPLGYAALKLDDVLLGYDFPVSDKVLKYKVYMGDYTVGGIADAFRTYNVSKDENEKKEAGNKIIEFWTGVTSGEIKNEFLTIEDIVGGILEGKNIATSVVNQDKQDISKADPNSAGENIQSFYNTSMIDPLTLTATVIKNNNLYWAIPMANAQNQANKYYYVLFDNPSDASATQEINDADTTKEDQLKATDPLGFVPIDSPKKEFTHAIEQINKRIKAERCLNYSKCKVFYSAYQNYLQHPSATVQVEETKKPNEVAAQSLAFSVYTTTIGSANNDKSVNLVFGPLNKNTELLNNDFRALNQRVAIKTMCKSILKKFEEIEQEKNEIIASVLGKANESRSAIYKQMHTIFHQWQVIASTVKNKELCSNYVPDGKENLAEMIEEEFGMCNNHKNRDEIKGTLAKEDIDGNTLFVYDYPLGPVNNKSEDGIKVKNSIINIEPLYKPNGNTTVLNIIQQICTKNNFMFVPFPGDANSDNITDIYKPYPIRAGDEKVRNYFHVLFTPTPETRTKLSNDSNEFLTDYMKPKTDFSNNAISVSFGSVNNQIIKGISVGTDSSKPTAESILNLQRLVDKENTNKKVSMDCSMLPVYEGRSYNASVDMIGNAQVYPMQYIYLQTMPMFGGLHQVMKVTHSITPNNMTTKLQAIRMRFTTNGSYGGIPPITLDSLEKLGKVLQPVVIQNPTGTYSTWTGSTVDVSGLGDVFITGSGGGAGITLDNVVQYRLPVDCYYQQAVDKKQICIHHTVGGTAKSSADWWIMQKNRVATQFVIDRDGKILQTMDDSHWAYHLGLGSSHFIGAKINYKKIDPSCIGIELANWGGLTKVNGVWRTLVDKKNPKGSSTVDPLNVVEYKDKYRGFEGFEKYPVAQLQSLYNLLKFLCEKWKIPITYSYAIFDISTEGLSLKPGIYTHTSYRTDKSDCHPQSELTYVLQHL